MPTSPIPPRPDVASFILGRYLGQGRFAYSPASEAANLYSTCFAVLALELIGAMPELPAPMRDEIADAIRNRQSERTGLFVEPGLRGAERGHDATYVEHQQTDFALLALGALGSEPKHRLHFLRDVERIGIPAWLDGLGWQDPWMESNRVMFVLNFLLHEHERGRDGSRGRVDEVLDWLDAHQDPENGLWNLGHRVSLVNQMAGAYHFLFFYTFLGRRPRHMERIIDVCLRLQDHDGLFTYEGGGGSCEDLDAIDLLCRCWWSTGHRTGEVRRALQRAHAALWSNQNDDGGFCWAKRDRLSIRKLAHVVRPSLLSLSGRELVDNAAAKLRNQVSVLLWPGSLTWAYSGLEPMRIPLSASDLWSTWFRLLSIAMIEETFPETVGRTMRWQMRTRPGLGFFGNPAATADRADGSSAAPESASRTPAGGHAGTG